LAHQLVLPWETFTPILSLRGFFIVTGNTVLSHMAGDAP